MGVRFRARRTVWGELKVSSNLRESLDHVEIKHSCQLRLDLSLFDLELLAVGRQVVVVLLSVALQVGDAGAIVVEAQLALVAWCATACVHIGLSTRATLQRHADALTRSLVHVRSAHRCVVGSTRRLAKKIWLHRGVLLHNRLVTQRAQAHASTRSLCSPAGHSTRDGRHAFGWPLHRLALVVFVGVLLDRFAWLRPQEL